jgi:hypothetical protein
MSVPPTHLEAFLDRVRAQTTCPVGPPPTQSERAIIAQLEGHVEHEKEALEAYEQLAATSPDEHVRYLAHMVLDDEAHHHRVLAEMLNRVRSDAEWRPVEPSVPRVRTSQDSRALLDVTARLLKTEREDLRQVRALKRRLRPQRRTSLLWLMADVLELDTRKHLRILEFLRHTARD